MRFLLHWLQEIRTGPAELARGQARAAESWRLELQLGLWKWWAGHMHGQQQPRKSPSLGFTQGPAQVEV